ncbi:hypothetical protein H310_03491 [Aphanomyces invadans]|uniref:Inositol-pentakisphosphate 2-kinase n=1 Tax=Aphanomyces invadans TaxID=157072 RepID=A0A024UHX7_9STRA|nr:hypothetical protein H310_03491 [Aphanomyces invadans]ETW05810.1 hypothetical protein H310_03491 [Aphanomyces invadans]|eukprot:XP_008865587.1 hypothetical protein H310_03491 [Aphanomyces invadans]
MLLSHPRGAASAALSASSQGATKCPSQDWLGTAVPAEWAYIAEGGANVIFRYAGSSESLAGWVMRVRKRGVHGAHPKDIVDFAEQNIPSGSRDAYVQVARAAKVALEFLVGLNALLESAHRPTHRRDTPLDTTLMWVLLLPDVTSPEVASLCIELKPKNSILPSTPHVHPIKRSVCRFCMHQHLKQAQGKLSQSSQYCPLDLFSNDRGRIARALASLTATPQNNLRVFSAVATQGVLSTDQVIQARRMDLLVEILHSHVGLLDDLKTMHAKDALDVEGMFALTQLHDVLVPPMAHASTLTTSSGTDQFAAKDSLPLRDVVATLSSDMQRQLDMHLPHAISTKLGCFREDWTALSVGEFLNLYRALLDDFFVATTFKDCSVFLSLRPISTATSTPRHAPFPGAWPMPRHTISWEGETYELVVAIVDLDIKSYKPVAAYFHLDHTIVEAYAVHVGHSSLQ